MKIASRSILKLIFCHKIMTCKHYTLYVHLFLKKILLPFILIIFVMLPCSMYRFINLFEESFNGSSLYIYQQIIYFDVNQILIYFYQPTLSRPQPHVITLSKTFPLNRRMSSTIQKTFGSVSNTIVPFPNLEIINLFALPPSIVSKNQRETTLRQPPLQTTSSSIKPCYFFHFNPIPPHRLKHGPLLSVARVPPLRHCLLLAFQTSGKNLRSVEALASRLAFVEKHRVRRTLLCQRRCR